MKYMIESLDLSWLKVDRRVRNIRRLRAVEDDGKDSQAGNGFLEKWNPIQTTEANDDNGSDAKQAMEGNRISQLLQVHWIGQVRLQLGPQMSASVDLDLPRTARAPRWRATENVNTRVRSETTMGLPPGTDVGSRASMLCLICRRLPYTLTCKRGQALMTRIG